MSTAELLFTRYGPTLSLRQLAEVLNKSEGTMYNLHTRGTMPVPTYMEGRKRVAAVADVAAYLDRRAEAARVEFKEEKEHMQPVAV